MADHDIQPEGRDTTTACDAARRDRLTALLAATDPDDDASAGDGADRHGPAAQDRTPRRTELRSRLGRVCVLSMSEVGVSGAGVTVMASVADGLAGHRGQLWATGAVTRRLEGLQLTAGEGPCLDAYGEGAPVLAADLHTERSRWLGFAPEAIAAGAAAVFSLPLQVGVVRLGTLDLHRDTVGALSRAQLAEALMLAALATETLLELADTGPTAESLETVDKPAGLGWLTDVHAEVHQASGMVAAQARIGVGEALLRLRGYAFAHAEPIDEVAARVIARDLVLDRCPDDPHDEAGEGVDGPHDGPPATEEN